MKKQLLKKDSELEEMTRKTFAEFYKEPRKGEENQMIEDLND